MERKCLIKGCNNDVYPQNEVDVKVAIITSNEPPICEICFFSEDEEVQKQIEEITRKDNSKLPF